MKKATLVLLFLLFSVGILIAQETSFDQMIGIYQGNLLYRQITYHFDNSAYAVCEVNLIEKDIYTNTILWKYRVEEYKINNQSLVIYDRNQNYSEILKRRPEIFYGSLYLEPSPLDYYEMGKIYIHINEDHYAKIDAYSLIPKEYAKTGEVVSAMVDSYRYDNKCFVILKFSNGDEETNLYERIVIIDLNEYLK